MALTQISTDGIKNGTITGSDLATNVDLVDNQKLRIGTGNDLEIYHNGSHSYIQDTGTGGLVLATSQLIVNNAASNEVQIIATENGAVELYHNNSKKFETTSTGITVTGAITSTGAVNGSTLIGTNISASSNINLNSDSGKLSIGVDSDLQLFHNGSNSYIQDNGTGALLIGSNGGGVFIRGQHGEESIIANSNGSVDLYHDNSKKFETTAGGSKVTGNFIVNSGHVSIDVDNKKLLLGASDDLQIFHDGTDSIITNSTGDLQITDTSDDITITAADDIRLRPQGGENGINVLGDGAVELYHDNSKKLHTKSSGIQVEGSGIFNGPGGNTTSLQLKNATDTDGTKLGHSSNSNAGFIQVTESNAGFNMQVGGPHDSNLRFQCLENSGNTQLVFGTEKALVAVPNGAIELYHDNVKRFETDSNGVRVVAPEGEQAILRLLGDEADDADDSFRLNAGGGTLKIQDASNQSFWEDNIVINAAGSVELYYNNVKMLDTSSQGVNFRGEIRSASTSSSLSNCTLKNESTGADGTDYFQCRTDNNTLRLVIEPDGDVKNQNNSYGQISDLKLKENIVDANSQWNDIKAIKVRNFNFKESTGFSTHTQIGVVAQELEIISPHLVYESTDRDPNTNVDLGTKTKNVRYSVMYMKAIKCLQEAMAKIEVLETEVAALKAA